MKASPELAQHPGPELVPLSPPFEPNGGAAWWLMLPPALRADTDDEAAPDRSRLRLFEDGRELGPGHALHELIRAEGGGLYSFWRGSLYFSTSDGSDPNSNGRIYTVAKAEAAEEATAAGPVAQATAEPKAAPAAEAAMLVNGRAEAAPGNAAPSPGTAGRRRAAPAAEPAWRPPTRPLRCAVLGLGQRGLHLAKLAHSFRGIEVAWAADQSLPRLIESLSQAGLAQTRWTSDVAAPLADPSVEAVIVTLPDFLHRPAAEAALRAGKHVLLEKPLATTVEDGKAILRAARQSGRVLQIGYVLREAPFYRTVRDILRAGTLGGIRALALSEYLGAAHAASYMRRWHRDSAKSGGLMVHKGCHDLDLACWLLDSRPRSVASFGGLGPFGAPAPARFCSECRDRPECGFADTGAFENRSAGERANPTAFGLDRCVFGGDKDIVDDQIVAFELDSGVRGSFHLSCQGGARDERRIVLTGDLGRLEGVFQEGELAFTPRDGGERIIWSVRGSDGGSHGGGDRRLMARFLDACLDGSLADSAPPDEALAGLVFASAAEEARRTGTVRHLDPADFALDGSADPPRRGAQRALS